ncbi:MAG TPA: type II secretion system protein, partial [Rhodospirillales bacterium]|nr:type II secretion system protein [Rhodospirillales bacterium]
MAGNGKRTSDVLEIIHPSRLLLKSRQPLGQARSRLISDSPALMDIRPVRGHVSEFEPTYRFIVPVDSLASIHHVMKTTKRNGFTLIELLVVIAI